MSDYNITAQNSTGSLRKTASRDSEQAEEETENIFQQQPDENHKYSSEEVISESIEKMDEQTNHMEENKQEAGRETDATDEEVNKQADGNVEPADITETTMNEEPKILFSFEDLYIERTLVSLNLLTFSYFAHDNSL
jgi:hypothetical protein